MKMLSKFLAIIFYFVLYLGVSWRVKLREKEAYQETNYTNSFKNYFVYWLLVFDKERNRHFEKAFQMISEQDEVLEVGTGFSAFLTLQILKRKPKQIISYEENTDSYLMAKKILQNFNNATLINNSPHKQAPTQPFNIIVQEIIGSIASAEGSAITMKSLVPFRTADMQYIPRAATTFFLPVEQKEFNWFEKVLDYMLVKNHTAKSFYRCYNFPLKKELAEARIFESLKFDQDNCRVYNEEHCFTINKAGFFSGLLFYVEVHFSEMDVLNTLKDKTNWSTPFLRMFEKDLVVEKGDIIKVQTEIDLSKKEPSYKIDMTLTTKQKSYTSQFQWEVVSRWQTKDLNKHALYQ